MGNHQESDSEPLLLREVSSLPQGDDTPEDKELSSLSNCLGVSIIASLVAGTFIVNASYSTIGPFYPKVAEEKGASPIMVGIITGITPLVAAVLSPFTSYLVPRTGLIALNFLGMLLVGVSTASLGFVDLIPSKWIFFLTSLVIRIAQGVGACLFYTASLAVIPSLYPNLLGTIFGYYEVAAGLGYSFGFFTGGILYKVGGFKFPFLFVGSLMLVITLPCTLLVGYVKMKGKKESLPLRIAFHVATDFTVIKLSFAEIISVVAISFYIPILEPFLRGQFDFNSVQISLVFLTQPIGYMFSSLFVGPFVDRLGYHRYATVLGLCLAAASLITMGILYDSGIMTPYIIGVALTLVGVGATMGIVPIWGDMLGVTGKYLERNSQKAALTALLSGVNISSFGLGEAFGSVIGGTLRTWVSFPLTSVTVGEMVLAEALLVLGVTMVYKCTNQADDSATNHQSHVSSNKQ